MFSKNLIKSGWLHALSIAAIMYPLSAIIQKLAASYSNGNLLAYTGIFTLSSACALLYIAGPGELIVKTLKRPETWVYGILQIASYLLFLFSLKYISATEGATLALMGGTFIILFSFIFLNQKVNLYELIGCVVMVLGFYLIIKNTPLNLETKALLAAIVIIRALVICGQKMITEVHKTNRKAKDFNAQVRVVGFIMFVTSLILIVFLLSIAAVKENNQIAFLDPFPYFRDFLNFKLWCFAVFLGFFVVSFSKYCEFYAGKTIGAKYLTSITSLQIIFIYFMEIALEKMGFMEARTFSYGLIISLGLVMLGNILVTLSGFLNNLKFIKKGEIQDTLANMDDKFVESQKYFDITKLNLSNLLALYDGDSKKLAQDLGLDRITIDNIMNYDFEDIKLDKKTANKISDFASKNVALKDKLTKAYNRYFLDSKINKLLKQKQDFTLYLLDLNKFKPINDTHGHEAGDIVLIETTKRLQNIPEFSDSVFRTGGDEFVLVQTDSLNKDLSEVIANAIKEPIKFEELNLEISTSIGLAQSKEHHSLQEIMAIADENMYKDKQGKGR